PGAGQGAGGRHVRNLSQRDMRDPALADAGPGQDPLVAGVQEGSEVRIAQHRGGHALAPAGDGRVSGSRHGGRIDYTPMKDLNFSRWRPHPWHGLDIGPNAPRVVIAYIEITPFDMIKYEIDKASGYLMVDRPQRSSSHPPALYGFIPRTY